jgi:uncharacterized protein
MILVLSPAKRLNIERQLPAGIQETLPLDHDKAWELIQYLRQLSAVDIARLMDLSPALAALTADRYHSFQESVNPLSAYCALLMFDGDVYDGLSANTLSESQWHQAQAKIRMLSGLYGVLRPLDLIQPYRLEMGTRLLTSNYKNLYQYWGKHIAVRINEAMATHEKPYLINLASEEYFKSIDLSTLNAKVVNCVFLDEKNGVYKTIGLFAKRTRGRMARFILDHSLDNVEGLKAFNQDGYQWSKADSTEAMFVFKRANSG